MFKNINRSVLLLFVSSFCAACMGGFAKALSEGMEVTEIVFFRNIIGVVIVGFALFNNPLHQKGGRPWLLLFRGVIGFLALMAWFYNVKTISLASAITFSNTSPIFTALFAYFLLKERLEKMGWFAILLGFLGILFIVNPQGNSLSYNDVVGLFSGIGAALGYTSIKALRKVYDTKIIVLSFMLVGTIGPVLLSLIPTNLQINGLEFLYGSFIMPSNYQWWLIAGLGISATLFQVLLTLAFGSVKAGVGATAGYANIVFSIFIGVAMGDDWPSFYVSIGISLIISSGILIAILKEKK